MPAWSRSRRAEAVRMDYERAAVRSPFSVGPSCFSTRAVIPDKRRSRADPGSTPERFRSGFRLGSRASLRSPGMTSPLSGVAVAAAPFHAPSQFVRRRKGFLAIERAKLGTSRRWEPKHDDAQIFRNGRHSRAGERRHHAGPRPEGRPGHRPRLPPRRAPPPGGDRQGYAPLRLHDRIRDGRGLYLGRHGRDAARPDADAGGRDADALDARRSRRDDLRLAQRL